MKKVAMLNGDNVVVNITKAKDDYELQDGDVFCSGTISPGATYDPDTQKFTNESPFPSWVKSTEAIGELNDTYNYEPPIAYPTPDSDGDNRRWIWDEDTTSWVTI